MVVGRITSVWLLFRCYYIDYWQLCRYSDPCWLDYLFFYLTDSKPVNSNHVTRRDVVHLVRSAPWLYAA